MAEGNQLRGWKEIAAFLRTSEKTARRWEGERGLPVQRQQGGGRDLVFASRDDLERWKRSEPGGGQAEETSGPGPAAQAGRVRRLGPGRVVVAAVLTLCAVWIIGEWTGRSRSHQEPQPQSRSAAARTSTKPAPVVLSFIDLEISRPDGWHAQVRIPDGGAGQVGGSPGHPQLVLRPRLSAAGLMLEVGRADGTPLKDQGGTPEPFVLLLQRDVVVQVPLPYHFSVRWPSEEPPPK
jgi:hypothetical protein